MIVANLAGLFGEIPWWPGDTDEVMIGAILTQQTRWENVERALSRLKEENLATMSAIYRTDPVKIEEAVRCTGFYRIKTRRLKALAMHVMDNFGGVETMSETPTDTLRAGLLSVPGIGEETADSILCYGFSRTSFVIDTYTERIVRCAGITDERSALKRLFEKNLKTDPWVFRQTHAHIVEYAKKFCARKRCGECQIATLNG
jgi:endonuclease-3 related protein